LSAVAQALRLASTLACGIVLIAFVLWATDATGRASAQQAGQAVAVAPAEPEHDGLRGAIESANDALVAPFDGVTRSTDEWVIHGVPMLLALLTYGLLARLLIAYLPRD
jgi:hypothetical protein